MFARNSFIRLFDIVVSFIILNLIFFALITFTSSNLKKLKLQTKEKKEISRLSSYLKNLEQAICQYNTILNTNLITKIHLYLDKKKLNLKIRIKLIGDNLYIYLLRNYIYKIIDKIIQEVKLRELIKDEILKVPETTFSEFLVLYHEIVRELI